MAVLRPPNSLHSLELWRQELGRELTESEFEMLSRPGGEAQLIAAFAAGVQPARLIRPDIPLHNEHHLPSISVWRPPVPIGASERSYVIEIGGDQYRVFGFWFAGHGRFAAYYGSSRTVGAASDVAGGPLSPLRLALLSAVIEQRAAIILTQEAWLKGIAALGRNDLRLEELAQLVEEGEGIVQIEMDRTANRGDAIVDFSGLADLGLYRAIWYMDDDDREIVSLQAIEVASGQTYFLDPQIPAHWVIIELCRLYIN